MVFLGPDTSGCWRTSMEELHSSVLLVGYQCSQRVPGWPLDWWGGQLFRSAWETEGSPDQRMHQRQSRSLCWDPHPETSIKNKAKETFMERWASSSLTFEGKDVSPIVYLIGKRARSGIFPGASSPTTLRNRIKHLFLWSSDSNGEALIQKKKMLTNKIVSHGSEQFFSIVEHIKIHVYRLC